VIKFLKYNHTFSIWCVDAKSKSPTKKWGPIYYFKARKAWCFLVYLSPTLISLIYYISFIFVSHKCIKIIVISRHKFTESLSQNRLYYSLIFADIPQDPNQGLAKMQQNKNRKVQKTH